MRGKQLKAKEKDRDIGEQMDRDIGEQMVAASWAATRLATFVFLLASW